jgi:hypothetical protein
VTTRGSVAEDEDGAPLNFRVSAEFRREFKTYAGAHDLKLNKLLAAEFPYLPATARRLIARKTLCLPEARVRRNA